MTRTTIRARLLRIFSVAILIPSLTTAVVAVWMIRQQVIAQAQARVTSDLEAAREIYDTAGDSLRDKLRIHATRAILYGALETATPAEARLDRGLLLRHQAVAGDVVRRRDLDEPGIDEAGEGVDEGDRSDPAKARSLGRALAVGVSCISARAAKASDSRARRSRESTAVPETGRLDWMTRRTYGSAARESPAASGRWAR